MRRSPCLALALLALPSAASAADSVMAQCGQQYQAAKAAGSLAGQSWDQFRSACATRLKAQPAASSAPVPSSTPALPAAAVPVAAAPVTPPAATTPVSSGRAAMLTREKACGVEWRAQKATLVAETPGLTWPKYWSQCNTRLKAAGQ